MRARMTPSMKKAWFDHVKTHSGFASVAEDVRAEFEKGVITRYEVIEKCRCHSSNEVAPAFFDITVEIPGSAPLYHDEPGLEWLPTDRYAPLVSHLEQHGAEPFMEHRYSRFDFATCGRCSYQVRCYVTLVRPRPQSEEGSSHEACDSGDEAI